MLKNAKIGLKFKNWLLVPTVILPVSASILYFGFVASDVYISESEFVIRTPDKPAVSGLGGILQSAGFANAGEEVYAAQSFAVSRDALRAINRNDAFKVAYTRPHISIVDRFNPFGTNGSFENLFRYFQRRVTLQNDTTTSITTLTVRAFNPRDAHRFNTQLLEMSEAMVNRLNERGRADLVRYAENEVATAKARSSAASRAVAAYRNQNGVVDPEAQAAAQLAMVSKLQDSLIAARAELSQLERYTPLNPRVPVVRSQIATLQQDIDRELGKVAGNRSSLAARAVRYQQLMLESQFAEKQLGSAMVSYEEARNEARRKQAYVERIVQPNLPDSPMEPRRLRGILATLALSLVAYGILRMLLAGVREHAQ